MYNLSNNIYISSLDEKNSPNSCYQKLTTTRSEKEWCVIFIQMQKYMVETNLETAICHPSKCEPFYSFNLMSSNCLQTPPNVLSRFPCSDELPAEEATCPCPVPDWSSRSMSGLHLSLFFSNHPLKSTAWAGVNMSRRSVSLRCDANWVWHCMAFWRWRVASVATFIFSSLVWRWGVFLALVIGSEIRVSMKVSVAIIFIYTVDNAEFSSTVLTLHAPGW